jgi:hypothetical protein
MKSVLDLLDLDKEQDYFMSLSSEQEETYLTEILAFANKNRSAIIDYCMKIEPTMFCSLEVVYEALSKDSDNWGEFIYEEFKRIFSGAKKSIDPFQYTRCLDIGLCFEEKNKPFVDKIINLLAVELDSPVDALRHRALMFLSDWIDDEDSSKYRSVMDKMLTKLRDSNWKIRYYTYYLLKDRSLLLGRPLTLNILDKFRGKYLFMFSSPFEMSNPKE